MKTTLLQQDIALVYFDFVVVKTVSLFCCILSQTNTVVVLKFNSLQIQY